MRSHSFSTLPSVRRRRTRFPDDWNVRTTMTVGKLYPIKIEEVVAGDDFKEDLSSVVLLNSSFIRPVMDNLFLDTYAFFVPYRILYDDYESVFGNPKPSAYTDNDLGSFPMINPSGTETVVSGTVADYLGLPIGKVPTVSVLPFRAFAMIYNQWFRNENTTDETYVQTGELGSFEKINNAAWSAQNYCGQLPYVGKIKDYFTSAVSSPQKGAPVTIPQVINFTDVPVDYGQPHAVSNVSASVKPNSGGTLAGYNVLGFTPQGSNSVPVRPGTVGSASISSGSVNFDNLYAKTSQLTANSVTVDQLRLATQRQLMLVADTMYGSRYREYLYGHFGVKVQDGLVQVPEFLSGKRIPLNIQVVAQTTGQAEGSNPSFSSLGTLGAYSHTASSRTCKYVKGFVEPGYVIWVACIRYKHSYSQGVEKLWTRSERDDFYDPLFAHIGYQPIYQRELFVNQSKPNSLTIFGYTEAWSEYKHTPSKITGGQRPAANPGDTEYNNFSFYNFGDYYSNAPVIGAQFNQENPDPVIRVCSNVTTGADLFACDFHCRSTKTRVMPLYCEPGYMDHWNK